jgi:hypothetical protein
LTSTWSFAAADKNHAAADKNPTAAMIFDRAAAYDKTRRHRDLRSQLPPTTRPAAAVIFDHRRRLRQDSPTLQNRSRRRLKPRRHCRTPAAAADPLPPPPKMRICASGSTATKTTTTSTTATS